MAKAVWLRQEWQYRLELTKQCYHPWLAAYEGRVSHGLSRVVWWNIYIYIFMSLYALKYMNVLIVVACLFVCLFVCLCLFFFFVGRIQRHFSGLCGGKLYLDANPLRKTQTDRQQRRHDMNLKIGTNFQETVKFLVSGGVVNLFSTPSFFIIFIRTQCLFGSNF